MKFADVVDRLFSCRRVSLPPDARVIAVALFIGVLSGLASSLLVVVVRALTAFLSPWVTSPSSRAVFALVPLVGIMIVGFLNRDVFRRNIEHDILRLVSAVVSRRPRLSPSIIAQALVGCSITLGCGGSAGCTGPLAYVGASIGSNVARRFGMSSSMIMAMMCIGASAGISAIFRSSVGGIFFTLEMLRVPLSPLSAVALVVACLSAFLTSFFLVDPSLHFHPFLSVDAVASLVPWILLFGVFCGLYSAYYSFVMSWLTARFKAVKPCWLRNFFGGISLSLLIFFLPVFYGEGYPVVDLILGGRTSFLLSRGSLWAPASFSPGILVLFLAAILLLKCWAACASNSSGGIAGNFAPTLFAGALAGAFFASFFNLVCHAALPVGPFAVFGMAAVMAGVLGAPFMAIFIAVEFSSSYSLLVPVILAAVISHFVARYLGSRLSIRPVYSLPPLSR